MRALFAAALVALPATVAAQSVTVHQITPSAVDPGVKAFDEPSIAMVPKGVAADAPLALVMTGTGGGIRVI